jgi:glucose 1-dehydrogenase
MRLRDKVAIVTGSTSGIGKAVAERFVAEGAKVAIVGRNAEHGQTLERDLRQRATRQEAGDALFVRADVSRPEDIREVVSAAVERWEQLDILVNNAAVMTFQRIADLDEADWDKVLGVNLKAAFLFTKHCLPHMREGGAIVNVSSGR